MVKRNTAHKITHTINTLYRMKVQQLQQSNTPYTEWKYNNYNNQIHPIQNENTTIKYTLYRMKIQQLQQSNTPYTEWKYNNYNNQIHPIQNENTTITTIR
jgi:hypothetical protein